MLVWFGEADPCASMERRTGEQTQSMVRVTSLMGELEARFGSGVTFTLNELVGRTETEVGLEDIHKVLAGC